MAGRPPSHPPTTEKCEACHDTTFWRDIRIIDHTQASIECAACHNARIAPGKPAGHIRTLASCQLCHNSTSSFANAIVMNHSGIASGCANCHNNVTAIGKPPNHIQTALPCESCHKSFSDFLGAAFTHQSQDTNCVSCHNGTTAVGLTTPPHIPTGTIQCSGCHNNAPGTLLTSFTTAPGYPQAMGAAGHAVVASMRCDSCHSGAYTNQGLTGAYGTASFPGHVATNGQDCAACHKSAATSFTSWAGAGFVHTAANTNCVSCHNGTTATGLATPPHIPTGTIQCSGCHNNAPGTQITSFATAPGYPQAMGAAGHAVAASMRCDSCHSGAYTNQGLTGAYGTASFAGHVATNGQDCAVCHKSAATSFTSWAGAGFVHTAANTNCVSCHNGTTATGLATPPHIPTGTIQCSGCHNNAPGTLLTSFTTAPGYPQAMGAAGHAVVASMRCDSCHSGAYTNQGLTGAYGTASFPGHVATNGQDCAVCHKSAATSFTSWAGAGFVHTAANTNCVSCHNGTTATGLATPPHIPTGTIQCSGCHNNAPGTLLTSFITAPGYPQAMGAAGHAVVASMRCDSCHSGAYTNQGLTGALGTASFAGHVATNGQDCAVCHKSAATSFTSWAGAGFVHTAANTNCVSCHNGTTATGLVTPPHIPTGTIQCSGCHNNAPGTLLTSFITAPGYPQAMGVAGHAVVASMRCDSCHSGAYTNQGLTGAYGTASFPGHVATNGQDCAVCHKSAATSFTSWAGAGFVHTAANTNCVSCHNGTTATGLATPPHIPTGTIQCSGCHNNAPGTLLTSFITAPGYPQAMGAAGHAVVASMRCDSCHSGAYTNQGLTGAYGTASFPGHVATNGQDCAVCHKSAATSFTSWAGAGFVHTAANTNCVSCHNGTTATGLATPPHIPTGTIQCSGCHSNAPGTLLTSFITAPGYPQAMGAAGHAVVASMRCDSCHSGAYTNQGLTGAYGTASFPGHVATNGQDCSVCHKSAATSFTSWAGAGFVHTAANTNCVSCHNGTTATGLATPPHIPTGTIQCSGCHNNAPGTLLTSFITAPGYPQAMGAAGHAVAASMRCDSCHSGAYTNQGLTGAYGTASFPGHVATNGQDCAVCHKSAATSFTSWAGAGFVHTAANTNCVSCHNGTTATGLATPPHIPTGTIQCSGCHSNAPGTLLTSFTTAPGYPQAMGAAGHAVVASMRCDSCHSGAYTNQGLTGAYGTASFPGHVATNGQDCAVCHKSAATSFTSWSGAGFVHTAANTNCVSCHNGTTATGLTTPPHIPTGTIQCSGCHNNAPGTLLTSFITAPGYPQAMGAAGHAVVASMRCDSCHSGAYTNQGLTGAYGTASFPGHVATNGQDCAVCHKSAATSFTSWAGAGFVHTAANTNCVSCHNGTTATGLATPPHIPTGTIQCSGCHSNAPGTLLTSFTTAPGYPQAMGAAGHAVVASMRCDSCHSGAYTNQGLTGAYGTASFAGHVATNGQDCSVCHKSAATSFTSWAGAGFVHTAANTNCVSCHNGTTATGLATPPHIPTGTIQCSGCHNNAPGTLLTSFITAPGYPQAMGAAGHAVVASMRCDSCHSGAYTNQGLTGAYGTASFPGHVATNGQDCAVCHKSAATSFTSWAGAGFVHTAANTNCVSCHNGTTATGLATPPHIPTGTIQCSGCHSNAPGTLLTSFTTAPGYPQAMGAAGHAVVASMRCDSCHSGAYTNQGLTGAYGTASFAGHVATNGQDCSVCHKSAATSFTSWAGAGFVHTAANTNCVSCHNGTTATGLATPPHIPTGTIQCSGCHNNAPGTLLTSFITAPGYPQAMGAAGHAVVASMRCDSCHSGAYTNQGLTGAYGTASFPGHVATNGQDCAVCHKSAATSFTSWSGAGFVHTAANTNCVSCHNGTTATGLATPPHIPTGTIQCSGCHSNAPGTLLTSFTTAPGYPQAMGAAGHAVVASMRCDSCHSGAYTNQGLTGAYGTASFPGHVATNGQDCAVCHKSAATSFTSWSGAGFVHTAANTNCVSCHNGTTATGLATPPHIPTGTIQCSGCHNNAPGTLLTSFTTAPGYPQAMGAAGHAVAASMRCDSCHSGAYTNQGLTGAYGTASFPGHVATNGQDCAVCHKSAATSFTSWAGAGFVHTAANTNCVSCHNGTTATGLATPPHIPTGTIQCSGCHNNAPGTLLTSFTTAPGYPQAMGAAGHAVAASMRCDSCHSGAYTNQGLTGAYGTASFPGHVATNGQDCAVCHKSAATSFTSWAGAGFVHTAANTNCVSCHNGTTATGLATPPHIPTGTIQCSGCHNNAPGTLLTSFITAPGYPQAMGAAGHAVVASMRCDSCHSGAYTNQGLTGAYGTASFPGHVATNGQDCAVCHKSAATSFTSWAGAGFVHTAANTNCVSCHNGTTATGLATPPHIPTGTIQCSGCHNNAPGTLLTSFITAPGYPQAMGAAGHAVVASMRCDSCHSGAYTNQGLTGAYGTASFPGHVATNGQDCAVCHKSAATSFTSWAGAGFVHTAANTNCVSCHNGTTATGLATPPHIPTGTIQCSGCHNNAPGTLLTSFITAPGYPQAMGAAGHAVVASMRCDSCHSGAYTNQGLTGAYGTASFPGHVATNGQDCSVCHKSAATSFTSWSGAGFVHTAANTNCVSCHNGTTATGLATPPHIPTGTIQCSGCHNNAPGTLLTSFTTAPGYPQAMGTAGHAVAASMRCDSCHSGAYTNQGLTGAYGTASFPGHVATNGQDCAVCHKSAATSFTSWAGAGFVHTAANTNCVSCHNGTTATGLATPPHIPTGTIQCSGCHNNAPGTLLTSFTTAPGYPQAMGTAGHAVAASMRCDSCHSGAYTNQGLTGAYGTASFPGHVATNGQDCSVCHKSAATSFTSWSGAGFVHTAANTNCVSCHNGTTATGLATPPHIPTGTIQCSGCHNNAPGTLLTSFITAPGYPQAMGAAGHAVVASMRCDSCHSGAYTNQGLTGAYGTASFPGHVATNGQDCSVCHKSAATSFTSWAGAGFVHTAANTNCVSCHNGTTATGLATPPHIPTGTIQCSGCHNNAPGTLLTSFITAPGYPQAMGAAGHAVVASMRCDSCHSGAYTNQGLTGAYGTASFPGHVATNGQDCAVCHKSAATSFTSWSGAGFVHTAANTNCVSCHNGTTATGLATPPHIPTGTIQCSGCHNNAPGTLLTSFTTAPGYPQAMGAAGHAVVASMRCDSCHSGAYTNQGLTGAYGTASFPGHVATNGQDCSVCHKSAATSFTSWAGAGFVHTAANTNCVSCHNGTTATGLATPPHIPTGTIQCSGCHSNAPGTLLTSFTTAPGYPQAMGAAGHAVVASMRCDSCHSGAYTNQGLTGAYGTASFAGHVATNGQDCSVCHKSAATSFTSWSGAGFVHTAANTNCVSCHNGTTATGLATPPHIPTGTIQCSGCHSNAPGTLLTSFITAPGYPQAMGAAGHAVVASMRCDSCHSGAYTNQGLTGAYGTASFPGHVATNGQDCAVCHKSAATSFTSWSGAGFVHTAANTNCVSCHNGTTATGLATPPHIPTGTIQCSGCHSNAPGTLLTSFITAPGYPQAMGAAGHAVVASMRCDSCHSGAYTNQGLTGAYGTASFPGHVATNGQDCSVCHKSAATSFTSWAGAGFVHTAANTNCVSCHNGTTATGLATPPHIPTGTIQCSGCHNNAPGTLLTSFITAPGYPQAMGAAGHAVAASMRCDSCHSGAYTNQGLTGAYGTASFPGHVATNGQDCAVCHKSAATSFTSWAGAGFVHTAANTNCVSCHNGTTATGLATPPHIPTGTIQCSGCHSNAPGTLLTSFTTAPGYPQAMGAAGHAVVASMRCDSCHSGAYTNQGLTGALGTASFAGHVATNGQDCAVCHKSAATSFTSWSGAGFVHTAANTNCVSCHNGTTATGLATPPHIPTGTIQCSGCHSNAPGTLLTSFTTAPGYPQAMGAAGHAVVASMRCDSCHSGAYTNQGLTGAYGTASFPGHVATNGQDCAVCHKSAATSFTSWSGAGFVHTAANTNCVSCHNGTTATGLVTPPHIPTGTIQCSGCHSNAPGTLLTSFTTAPGYPQAMGAAGHAVAASMRCDSCHSGAYTNQGLTGALGTASFAGHVATNGQDCAVCHKSAATSFTSWSGAGFVHTAANTNCVSCHNGTTATGLATPPHIPTGTIQCSGCHSNAPGTLLTSFTTAPGYPQAMGAAGHAVVASMRCDSCHSGAYTNQGLTGAYGTASFAGHVATNGQDCSVCHKSAATSFTSWSGAGFVHTAANTNCVSCHNGTTATGLATPPHIPTGTIQCSGCHSNAPGTLLTSFITAPGYPQAMGAAGHAVAASMRCDSCHSGAYTNQGLTGAYGTASFPGHVATNGQDCAVCHKSAATSFTSWSGAGFVHTAANTNCVSCHNGTTATGLATPPHIPTGTIQCSGCHSNAPGTLLTSFITAPGYPQAMGAAGHAVVASMRCDSCHSGAYTNQGLTGAYGTASFPGHVATNGQDCAVCHKSAATSFTSWSGAGFVHTAANTNCVSCHNGTTATGLATPPHIPTGTIQCSGCHSNAPGTLLTSFITAPGYPQAMGAAGHAVVASMRCDSCHSGAYTNQGLTGALGTASFAGHVATNGQDCAVCHKSAATSFTSWAGAGFVHTAANTNCVSCHNGTTATGLATPPHIPTGTIQCSGCHSNAPGTLLTSFTTAPGYPQAMGAAGHAVVASMRCDSCHSGAYTNQGLTGAYGTASFPGHVATNGQDCAVCHKSAATSFTSWSGAGFVHTAANTNCVSCHNGTTATGLATPPHIPTGTIQCSGCHNNAPGTLLTSFTTAPGYPQAMGTAGHAVAASMRCDSCHSGAYTNQGLTGALGTASFAGHVATNGQDCSVCHKSAATSFTSWSGAGFVHTAANTNCVSCHNGTTATGLATPPHIPTGTIQCSGCHNNAPGTLLTSFTTAPGYPQAMGTAGHAVAASMRCDSCHSGAYTNQGLTGAYGTASFPGHVATNGQDCAVCHKSAATSFTSWSGAGFVHTAANTNCVSCHNGTTATGLATPPHIPTGTIQCSGCHSNAPGTLLTSFITAPGYPQAMGAAGHAVAASMRCDSCHSGAYTNQGLTGAYGTASFAGHVATNGQDCAVCHKSAATSFTSWAGAGFVHTAANTNCVSCHNGTTATGLATPPHIPTGTIQCSGCHSNAPGTQITSFATAPGYSGMGTTGHAAVTAMRCDSCHNGSFTSQGTTGAYGTSNYANHVPTNGSDCITCHATARSGGYSSWAGGAYVHAATDTNCTGCHNGATAVGLTTPPHVPVGSVQCGPGCHSNSPGTVLTSFATAPGYSGMGTTGHAVVHATRCDTCHNGAYRSQGTSGGARGPDHSAKTQDCGCCHVKAAQNFSSWDSEQKPAAGCVTTAKSLFSRSAITNLRELLTNNGLRPSSRGFGTPQTDFTLHPSIPGGLEGATTPFQKPAPGVVPGLPSSPTTGAQGFDHLTARGPCAGCHNGRDAIGKPAKHIATSATCDSCHKSTRTFAGAHFDHAAVAATSCASCHNGKDAIGKPAKHIATSATCDSCHKSTRTFAGAHFDHAAVAATSCASCHNGKDAIGKPAKHIATSANCDTCHKSTRTFAGAHFDHAAVAATSCASCHNGRDAIGKPAKHIATSANCDSCHKSTRTFAGARFDHAAVAATSCASCHNGRDAIGKPAKHIATSANCDSCHKSTRTFAGARVDHAAVAAMPCADCHNGRDAIGKPAKHIPTAAACDSCHKSIRTFAGARLLHAAVASTPCANCHDGKTAIGKPEKHIATTAACDSCHKNTLNFGGITFNHSAVVETPCANCHNGRDAVGKPMRHVMTSAPCDDCHKGTLTFTLTGGKSIFHGRGVR
ncbi:cytochrome c3 family protein [Methylocystis bryophila]|uniref:cytochrome c3 family protein n=1 Tax=Methylocystis bryophila TaxID=655015 RepID=UPI0024911CD2|nr:cytochrome c3 family protein [Methylocystis bryophila]